MATSEQKSYLDFAIRWGQVLAVAAAGIWAVFQFGVNEASKAMVLELEVEPSIGAPLAGEYFGGLIPITLDIEVRNAGDKGVNILLGTAVFGTELFPDLQATPPHPIRYYTSMDDVGFSYSSAFGERTYGGSFAFEFFAPAYWINPGENKKYQALAFGYSEEDTLFSYEVYYLAAERCEGIFPFTTCYEFSVDVTERAAEETCDAPHAYETVLGGDIPMCVQTFRGVEGSSTEAQPVSLDEMISRHKMALHDRHGTVIFRYPTPTAVVTSD
ncbi:MAG: hypothetical protein AAF999_10525 [Pseudomonadota bacterium]